MIRKTAINEKKSYKPLYYYDSARSAFRNILSEYMELGDYTLLLPGYIGVSPNEGSGIYDPVFETKIPHLFYKMDKELSINRTSLQDCLNSINGTAIVLIVHYFGYPDKNIDEIVEDCKAKNAVIIEDAAHAMYTDYIDHSCGFYGDYVLYSLHKMLPYEEGGMLKVNLNKAGITLTGEKTAVENPFDYDLFEIARARKENAKLWDDLLRGHEDVLRIMRPYSETVTPQTFPIVVLDYDRTQLYFKLNELGFGAVSLYHTMIAPVREGDFKDAVWLSQHIINMPVHQDAEKEQIKEMAKHLLAFLKENVK